VSTSTVQSVLSVLSAVSVSGTAQRVVELPDGSRELSARYLGRY